LRWAREEGDQEIRKPPAELLVAVRLPGRQQFEQLATDRAGRSAAPERYGSKSPVPAHLVDAERSRTIPDVATCWRPGQQPAHLSLPDTAGSSSAQPVGRRRRSLAFKRTARAAADLSFCGILEERRCPLPGT